MGKASSAKKVARAAKAGGTASADQRKLGFPAAIIAIVVLGLGLVVVARSEYTSANSEENLDWQDAYGVYACNTFIEPFTDTVEEVSGVELLPDGIVGIRRRNVTLGEFGQSVGMTIDDGTLTLPDGTTYTDGDDCDGEPGRVVVARWPADAPDADPTIFETSLSTVRFVEDRGVIAVAFLPESKDVPRPPSVPALGASTDATTTTAPATSDSSSTTVATGDTSTDPSAPETSDPAGPDTTAVDGTADTAAEGSSEPAPESDSTATTAP